MKVWNIGIIGAGNIADFHAKAVQSLNNAKLIGICGTNSQKVKVLADRYACEIFTTTDEMFRSNDIDMVIIATPSGVHMEDTIEAAKHGKHVLCEKPLDVTLPKIDAMIDAHKKNNTRLGGIFNYRFNESLKILKKAFDDGRFGIITNASVFVPWWRSDEYYSSSWRGTWELDGGGALMNQSIHMIDLLQYLMGPVESLNAYVTTLGHPQIEVEDTAVAILKFKNKSLGMIYGSTASYPGQSRRLEITGTKGTVVMEENNFNVWKFADSTSEDKQIIEKYSAVGESGYGASDPTAIPFEPHARNIASFIESIEEDKPFAVDGEEARKSVEIILAIYQSARENKEVKFK